MLGVGGWRVSLSDIDFSEAEEHAVLAVLRSKWLSMGPVTEDFERRFAAANGVRHAVAVSNCTAALHLALLAAGVKPGDEVIVPALTFVATANAVLYCGATPVFADIVDSETLTMDPEDVARKVSERTTAIVPMHYGGYACDVDRLRAIHTSGRIRIVADAAHAVGASWRGQSIGRLADASCFSFFSNKNLVTGEGGMITTDDDEIAASARLNRAHGMTTTSYERHRGHAFAYDVVSAGYNYRITELQAALGLVQLEKLDHGNATRRVLVAAYRARLAGCEGLVVPFRDRDEESSCHIMEVVLPEEADRSQVQDDLKERGIQSSIHYTPVHWFTNFSGRFRAEVPKLEAIARRLLTLPLHPLMTATDVAYTCDGLIDSLDSQRARRLSTTGARE